MASTDAGARALELLETAVGAMGGSPRPGQQTMAEAVADALESERHLLVQAGTGTGKSLGYLVPMLSYAQRCQKPLVIATATLALQSQIVRREVPRLLKAVEGELSREVSVALLKGRSNYACLHKMQGGYPEDEEDALFEVPEEKAAGHPAPRQGSLADEVMRIREWIQETETGDRDELVPGVSNRAWRQASVSAQECLGAQKCPLAEVCFSERAKEEAHESDIIITNHALLAISAFEGVSVLPEYAAVVVDEAHELQDRVTTAVTGSLSSAMILAAAKAARKADKRVDSEALEGAAEAFDAELRTHREGLWEKGLGASAANMLAVVRDTAREALSVLKPQPGEDIDAGAKLARARLQEVFATADRMIAAPQKEEILWVERQSQYVRGQGYSRDQNLPAVLSVAPISVAMQLRDGLFDGHTVVLTSATLALGGNFQDVLSDLGLLGPAAPAFDQIDVGSPFDYPKQGILYTPRDLPAPSSEASQESRQMLLRLLKASDGAALGLFSSRRAAEEAAEWVRGRVDFPVLCQGEGAMNALIEQFAQDERTCLFGTMTLWQGVDVPGHHNRLVVIDRIPFPRPDDPVANARSAAISSAGGSGFMRVSVASAAVKLAQGVGRLIRSQEDRGVVAILDSRIKTKRYGRYLLSTLPNMWPTESIEVVESALRRLADAQK